MTDFPDYSAITLERDGAIAWLTLNRPHRLNAMNQTLLSEFENALDVTAKDDPTRVVIIKGSGRAFCTGYDIERDETSLGRTHDIVDDHDRLSRNMDRFLKIWDHPKPVIAAVHGYCLAGATQLCIFCDITVVAEDAVVGWPALPMGGGYISPLWVPLVGPKRAKQMSFVAKSTMSGTTSAEWGWANYAVPAAELLDNVRALGLEIAKIPPTILRMKKLAVNRVMEVSGFRATVKMGAETDALLHYSNPVQSMARNVHAEGLKATMAKFAAGEGWPDESEEDLS